MKNNKINGYRWYFDILTNTSKQIIKISRSSNKRICAKDSINTFDTWGIIKDLEIFDQALDYLML